MTTFTTADHVAALKVVGLNADADMHGLVHIYPSPYVALATGLSGWDFANLYSDDLNPETMVEIDLPAGDDATPEQIADAWARRIADLMCHTNGCRQWGEWVASTGERRTRRCAFHLSDGWAAHAEDKVRDPEGHLTVPREV